MMDDILHFLFTFLILLHFDVLQKPLEPVLHISSSQLPFPFLARHRWSNIYLFRVQSSQRPHFARSDSVRCKKWVDFIEQQAREDVEATNEARRSRCYHLRVIFYCINESYVATVVSKRG
jgi:hypothetical protein